jgi:hypothetical protein
MYVLMLLHVMGGLGTFRLNPCELLGLFCLCLYIYVCNNTVVDELLLMEYDIANRNMCPSVLNVIQFGEYRTFHCLKEIVSHTFIIYFSKYLRS